MGLEGEERPEMLGVVGWEAVGVELPVVASERGWADCPECVRPRMFSLIPIQPNICKTRRK